MKRIRRILLALLLPAIWLMGGQGLFLVSGCANIVAPLGGPKDSLPPFLVSAAPRDSATDFNVRKIQLNFNEFIQLDNITENLIISPTPKRNPEVTSKLRTLTITLKDTPEPNTTYTYDFGKGIKDVNEGNILKNFQFRFSTGKELASGTLSGKVVLAADGKVVRHLAAGVLDDAAQGVDENDAAADGHGHAAHGDRRGDDLGDERAAGVVRAKTVVQGPGGQQGAGDRGGERALQPGRRGLQKFGTGGD